MNEHCKKDFATVHNDEIIFGKEKAISPSLSSFSASALIIFLNDKKGLFSPISTLV